MGDGEFDDLLATFAGPPMPAQPRLPVRYDAAAGELELGGLHLSVEGTGNRAVLEAFVALVETVRESRPTTARHLRRLDLTALATVLDTSDAELEAHVQEIFGVRSDTAHAVSVRLARCAPVALRAPVVAAR
jgi:hypothetical protein